LDYAAEHEFVFSYKKSMGVVVWPKNVKSVLHLLSTWLVQVFTLSSKSIILAYCLMPQCWPHIKLHIFSGYFMPR